jgi:predicted nucleic acid-binding protein
MRQTAVAQMMSNDVFFDSNVILYLAGSDVSRASRSELLLEQGGVISVQVLNEIANVLRSRKWLWPWPEVHAFLAPLRTSLTVMPVTKSTHERGIGYAERYQLAMFDANIVAAAVLAGCTTLYSEDMHNGLVIDGLTIRNPFAAKPFHR